MTATFTATMGDRAISVRGLSVDGAPWLNARDVALALGYSKGNAAHLVRSQVAREQRRQLRELDPSSNALDMFVNEDALFHLAGRRKGDLASALLEWLEATVLPSLRGLPADVQEAPADVQEAPAEVQVATAPEPVLRERTERLFFLRSCKDAAEAWGLPLDPRMRDEVKRILADALLPNGEHDADYVDAAGILRESGHAEAHVRALAGELGKDLKLASGGDGHQSTQLFGADHDKLVRRYHRIKDSRLIATVMASFKQRAVYIDAVGSSLLDPYITGLLEQQGRGRKRAAPSGWQA
jgi:prophage antirepressor-like protein